jgi:AcrR family transcriptional regulator
MTPERSRITRIVPPQQARSRATMDRILSALSLLLEAKPFDEITIVELARRARCTVTSIYARFEDKRALILALHERHRDEMIAGIDRLLDPARWRGAEGEAIVRAVFESLLAMRKRRRNLLRAVALLNDGEVYERAAQIIRHSSERLNALLAPLYSLGSREFARRIDFAVRVVNATVQQREIFGAAEPARFRMSERELHARLIRLFLAALAEKSE